MNEIRDLTSASVVCDSIGPHGHRLLTMEMTYPLIIHNELMTYRVLSRNTASNRAIPVRKMIDAVLKNPFVPQKWPKNQSGMQAQEFWPDDSAEARRARRVWLTARDRSVESARVLIEDCDIHKQIANRLLGPFLYTTAVVSSTRWANLYYQRCHGAAQPEMQGLAYAAQYAHVMSTPTVLRAGDAHLPYVTQAEKDYYEGRPGYPKNFLDLVSVARVAAVSYLKHGEDEWTPDEAYERGQKRETDGHWSPFEHVGYCRPDDWPDPQCGNFIQGWTQLRKLYPDENRPFFKVNHPALIGSGHDTEVLV
jgi:hypothetical protein